MTPSPETPNKDDDNFLGFFYRVEVDSLNDWAIVTQFRRYEVQEPDVTEDFKQFLNIMYGSNWKKKVLTYRTMIVEQLDDCTRGYGELTSRRKQAWLNQFNCWTPA